MPNGRKHLFGVVALCMVLYDDFWMFCQRISICDKLISLYRNKKFVYNVQYVVRGERKRGSLLNAV